MNLSHWPRTGTRIGRTLDQLSDWIGRTISWLTLLIVLLMVGVVLLRYVLNIGSIALQESVMYLHGAIFMLGAGYTLKHNEHVRVDIFYSRLSARGQAWVNLLGTLLLLLPVCVLIFWVSLEYVQLSWLRQEGSADAGGLPFVYVLKSLLLVMPVLIALQGVAEALRALAHLAGYPESQDA